MTAPTGLSLYIFERALGFINLIVFLSFHVQHKGLIGSNGITPAYKRVDMVNEKYKSKSLLKRFGVFPSFFLLNCSDQALRLSFLIAEVCALCLMFNVVLNAWFCVALCGVFYLSLICVSNPWMGMFCWFVDG